MTAVLASFLLIGLAVGLGRGGRLAGLSLVRFRSAWLLIVGAGLRLFPVPAANGVLHAPSNVVSLVAEGALVAFAICNLVLPGMGVVLAGAIMNVAPIAINHGMPVEGSAIVAAGGTLGLAPDDPGGHHLATASDHWRALDDGIPEGLTHHVLSTGDLTIAVGVGALAAGFVGSGARRRTPRSRAHRARPRRLAVPTHRAGPGSLAVPAHRRAGGPRSTAASSQAS